MQPLSRFVLLLLMVAAAAAAPAEPCWVAPRETFAPRAGDVPPSVHMFQSQDARAKLLFTAWRNEEGGRSSHSRNGLSPTPKAMTN